MRTLAALLFTDEMEKRNAIRKRAKSNVVTKKRGEESVSFRRADGGTFFQVFGAPKLDFPYVTYVRNIAAELFQ